MPLTPKGEKIEKALKEEYGPEKGEHVLYAGKNAGTFTGIDDLVQLAGGQSGGLVAIPIPETGPRPEPRAHSGVDDCTGWMH